MCFTYGHSKYKNRTTDKDCMTYINMMATLNRAWPKQSSCFVCLCLRPAMTLLLLLIILSNSWPQIWVSLIHFLSYVTCQDDISPAGGFSLRGCLVSSLDDNGVPSGESLSEDVWFYIILSCNCSFSALICPSVRPKQPYCVNPNAVMLYWP